MTQCKRMDPYEMECQINALQAENMSLAQKLHEKEEQVKKERSFLFSLIDGIPAFIYLQSKDYSIKYANRVFFDLFGDYEGRPCYKVMNHRDTPCEECRTFWVFDAKMPQQWSYCNHDGRFFRIYDYPFTGENGEELVLEMGIDITQQQKYEDSRSNLFANISHELRTPLARILGFTELLRDQLYTDEKDTQKLIGSIHTNSIALNQLIEDLFELSKLETTHTVTLRRVQLHDVFMDFCEEQVFFLKSKQKKFRYVIDNRLPVVMVDTNRLVQVLRNLVENASCYTGENGEITLSAFSNENNLFITVSDTGKGIPPEDINKVFTRFYQGARVYDDKNHRGLGLYICKTIIQQHNGKIWADSKLGEGTTFSIKLLGCDENFGK